MRPRLGAPKHHNGRPGPGLGRAPRDLRSRDGDTPGATHRARYTKGAAPVPPGTAPDDPTLSAQTEPLDQRAVALDVLGGQVLQQPAALADQLVHAATGVVVVLVRLEVLGQVVDPLGQQRDLDLRGAGVAFGGAVLGENLLLRGDVERHRRLLRGARTWAHSVCVTSAGKPVGAWVSTGWTVESLSDPRSARRHGQRPEDCTAP